MTNPSGSDQGADERSRPRRRRSVMVITSVSDAGSGLPSAVLDSIENETDWIEVVANGLLRFSGTPGDLAATSIDLESLAGEHPIELSLRLLLHGPIDPMSSGIGDDADQDRTAHSNGSIPSQN